jgi:hypothetical protein
VLPNFCRLLCIYSIKMFAIPRVRFPPALLLPSPSQPSLTPEPCPESWSLFCYVVPASRLAGRLFPVSSMRGRMPLCLRTNTTFSSAASQPNLYIDSAPSGAFPNSINIYYDYYYILSSTITVRFLAIQSFHNGG